MPGAMPVLTFLSPMGSFFFKIRITHLGYEENSKCQLLLPNIRKHERKRRNFTALILFRGAAVLDSRDFLSRLQRNYIFNLS